MIEFDLSFRYAEETKAALRSAAGEVADGRCIVLCGGSGCGKSTLLRCLNGLVPQFYEGELTGFCQINGESAENMTIGEIGKLASSVFQDPRSQFFTINSSGEVAFGLENHGVSQEKMRERVDAAFHSFNLERLKNRNVYELSSGERQLVSILSAWAMNTDIVLLDEPTANLDFSAIEQLRAMLLKLKSEGKTLILSEHRLYYLNGLADEYWLMADGEIKRKFTAEEMAKMAPEEVSAMSLRVLNLDAVRVGAPSNETANGKIAFSAENISYRYKKQTSDILADITLRAEQGEIVGLIGRNGCGKTTFGKIASGLLRPSSGRITYGGETLCGKHLREKALFIMQEAEFQFFTNSVINELKYGRRVTHEFEEKVEELLRSIGMWECRTRHPFSLSGGQMQKLTLMMAYLSEKPIVVLDEPTAGLDAESLVSCCELIKRMQKEKLVFIITHDTELIASVCTRCVCLSNGRAVREFPVRFGRDIQAITEYMQTRFCISEEPLTRAKPRKSALLHPVTKLLYWIASIVVISVSHNNIVFSVFGALLLMAAADGWFGMALAGGGIFALLWGADMVFPHTVISFMLVFFPRILSVGLATRTLIGRNEATRTLAALRKIHLPERLIMICAVIFRFFPVLSKDMKLLRESIRTRGAFVNLSQKLRALPEYIEILTVPMALRVIRIAETLSASAETRGIDLRGRKSNYISLRYRVWDILFTLLLTGAVVVGLVL